MTKIVDRAQKEQALCSLLAEAVNEQNGIRAIAIMCDLIDLDFIAGSTRCGIRTARMINDIYMGTVHGLRPTRDTRDPIRADYEPDSASYPDPTMAKMPNPDYDPTGAIEKLRAWVNRDNDEEPSPLPQGTTEYLVVTRDADNNTEAFRYFNKTEAYEAAKAEHIYNTDIDVSIAQVIAIVDTTPYIREV